MEIALLLVGAGLIGSIIAFSFYCVRTILAAGKTETSLTVKLTQEQYTTKDLADAVERGLEERTRLMDTIRFLERQHAKLLENTKFINPGDAIDNADDQLRGKLPTP